MLIIEKDFNVLTGEETITEREMNQAEIAAYEKDEKLRLAEIEALEKKAAEKAVLLTRLGLTEDELKTILK